MNILKDCEENVKKKDICVKYNCEISTLYRIIRNKEEIRQSDVESKNLQQKRKRKGLYENVENALAVWFDQQRQKNGILTSLILINKAKEFAVQLGVDLEPDSNWLFRWKKRQNIKVGQIHGEANSKSKENEESYCKTILPNLIDKYLPEDIMNADESGLFYKALPLRTYYRPDCQRTGHKSQKARITLLFLCNSTGSFKRVYAIGKSKNPRCLKNVSPPIRYMWNKKAWMTTDLWCSILNALDVEMQAENRKIKLFADNASCHKTPQLKNIEVQYLPPNTTAILQPLDQGIIYTFKTYYRQIIVKKQISALEREVSIPDFYKSITLLDVLFFVKRSWWLVNPGTISNCFRKVNEY